MKRFLSMALTFVFVLSTFVVPVSAADTAVQVDITSIVDGQTFTAGSNVSIEIDASTLPAEGVKNIDVYANGSKLPGTIAGVSGSIVWYGIIEGEYDITTKVTYIGGATAVGDETLTISAVSADSTQIDASVVPVATAEIGNGATGIYNEIGTYRINFSAPIYQDATKTPATVKDASGTAVTGVTYTYGVNYVDLTLPVLENNTTYTVSIPANTILSYYSKQYGASDVYVAATDFTFTTRPHMTYVSTPVIKMSYPTPGASFLTNSAFAAKVVAPSTGIASVVFYDGETAIGTGVAMSEGEYWLGSPSVTITAGETKIITVKMFDAAGNLLGAASAAYNLEYAAKGIYEGAVVVAQHESSRKIKIVDKANLNIVSDVATGVSRVEFYKNNELVATDNNSPYEYDLAFDEYGANKLDVKVYDAFNNVHSYEYNYTVVKGEKNSASFEDDFDSLTADSTIEELMGKTITAYNTEYVTLSANNGGLSFSSTGSSKTTTFAGIDTSEGKHKVYYYEFDLPASGYGTSFWVRSGSNKPEIFNTYTNVTTNDKQNSYFTNNKPTMRLIIDYAATTPKATVYFNDQLWKCVDIPILASGVAFFEASMGNGYGFTIDNFKYAVYDAVSTNVAPEVTVSAPVNVAVGETITLTAQASDTDGTVGYVEFYADGTLIEGSRTETGVNGVYTFNWVVPESFAAAESVAITAKVYDTEGAEGVSTAVTLPIVVKIAPVLTILNPANGAAYNVSTAEGFTAVKPTVVFEASDSDGTIADISVYVNDVKDGSVANPESATEYTLTNALAAGTYTIKVAVTDNVGCVTNASVDISVVTQDTITAPAYAVKGIYEGAHIVAQQEATRTITVVDSANANIVSDAATSVDKVEFYKNNELVATDYSAPYEYELASDKYEDNTLEIKVYDVYGNMYPFSYNYYVANGVANSASFEEDFDDSTKDYSTDAALKALFVGGDGANVSGRLTLSVEEFEDGNALRIDGDGANKAAYLQFRSAASTTGAGVHYYEFDMRMSNSYSRNLSVSAAGYTKTGDILFNNKNTDLGIGTNSAIAGSKTAKIRLILDYNTSTALVYKNGELWRTVPLTTLADGTQDPVVTLYVQTHSSSHQVYIDNFKYAVYDVVSTVAPEPAITYDSLQTDGEISLAAKPTNMETIEGTIFAALYDNDDRVTEVKEYDAAESVPVEFVQTTGNYIKLFWWYLEDLTPYSVSEKIDL